jgi:hypothetical protein
MPFGYGSYGGYGRDLGDAPSPFAALVGAFLDTRAQQSEKRRQRQLENSALERQAEQDRIAGEDRTRRITREGEQDRLAAENRLIDLSDRGVVQADPRGVDRPPVFGGGGSAVLPFQVPGVGPRFESIQGTGFARDRAPQIKADLQNQAQSRVLGVLIDPTATPEQKAEAVRGLRIGSVGEAAQAAPLVTPPKAPPKPWVAEGFADTPEGRQEWLTTKRDVASATRAPDTGAGLAGIEFKEFGGKLYRIDKRNNEAVAVTMPGGAEIPGGGRGEIPAAQAAEIGEMQGTLQSVQDLKQSIAGLPKDLPFSGPLVAKKLPIQRVFGAGEGPGGARSPEAIGARAELGSAVAEIRLRIAGSTVSPTEKETLRSFLPDEQTPPNEILPMLAKLEAHLQRLTNAKLDALGTAGFDVSNFQPRRRSLADIAAGVP